MKVNDVDEWVKTQEGKQWLELQKQPLIDKRSELLEEINSLKSRLTADSEKGNALEAKLNGYLEKLRQKTCYGAFDDLQTFNDVLLPSKELREFVLNKIVKTAEADGGLIAKINDSGEFSYATSDGKTFADYYKDWLKTDEAKDFIKVASTGGGARGDNQGMLPNDIEKLTVQQIASGLSDKSFRENLQTQLQQKK